MAIETIDGNIVINNGIKRLNRVSKGFGIKLFEGNPLPSQVEIEQKLATLTPELLREEQHIWRPDETLQAAEVFFKQGKILIEGSPQNGKGTILFGISNICDIFGWGYYFIDGHFCTSPAESVIDTLSDASARGFCIFYDSFDYLFLKSAKLRRLNLKKQSIRTESILAAVKDIKSPIAMTEHDDQWKELFLNIPLRERSTDSIESFPKYVIPDQLQSREAIIRFMIDHDIDPKNAQFFANMENNPFLINSLTNLLGDKTKVDLIFTASQRYPVLKKLVRFFNGDFNKTLTQVLDFQPEAIRTLSQMVLEFEYERVFLVQLRRGNL